MEALGRPFEDGSPFQADFREFLGQFSRGTIGASITTDILAPYSKCSYSIIYLK